MSAAELQEESLAAETIKKVIAKMISRPKGMTIYVSVNCGRAMGSEITLKGEAPEIAHLLPTGHVGLRVEGHSYVTADNKSAENFKDWLRQAALLLANNQEIGNNPDNPGEIRFKCIN